jgi:hypothetical protein
VQQGVQVGSYLCAVLRAVGGPYSVNAYCFDTASKLVATYGTYAEPNSDLVPGARISLTIDLYRARCQNYLVGSSGYFG